MRPGRCGAALAAGVAVAVSAAATARVARADGAAAAKPPATRRALAGAELDVIADTETVLVRKYHLHERRVRAELAALYRRMRGARVRLWVDPGERAAIARRRADTARLLRRDLHELVTLRAELASVARSRARITAGLSAPASAPQAGSLARPVPGAIAARFGIYRDPESGARIDRRGIELSAAPGQTVRAVAPGRVRYAGPIRGLGDGVIVAHRGFLSVVGDLGRVAVTAGRSIGRGAALGQAGGDHIYLEVRLDNGNGGLPIDPEPLISAPGR